jgi:hypothetical protein
LNVDRYRHRRIGRRGEYVSQIVLRPGGKAEWGCLFCATVADKNALRLFIHEYGIAAFLPFLTGALRNTASPFSSCGPGIPCRLGLFFSLSIFLELFSAD